MSKVARAIVGILIILIVVSFIFAFWALMKRQELEKQNQGLQAQVLEYQTREADFTAKLKKSQEDIAVLTQKIADKERERAQAQTSVDELKRKADEFTAQLDQTRRERDDWKSRIDVVSRERDGLVEQLKNRPTQIVYKEKEPEAVDPSQQSSDEQNPPSVTTPQGEDYWAKVLKQKAALQLEIEKVKGDLDKSMVQIADLRKENSDYQLEIKRLSNEKEEIESKIKYAEDLANNLSVDLARARNDQKFVGDRAEKLKEENLQLQDQIKQLTSNKVALEKTISRISEDKANIQKKLIETESVIQGRINEIWQIKESVDKRLADSAKSSSQEVDLPPIIVNPKSNEPQAVPVKPQASIISINESNNFVITDMGENTGVKVGNVLKVMREGREIGTLEVIQVRKDICAADIKQKSDVFKIGDVVRPFLN